ncbi:flagellar motor protein MotB [Aidingimonas lacisalsi]|uniref:flagellar motor protein MotB n=1 Tax=Aidingimonas lacisalsi TaxID=2604086 RepID=UPI0011D21D4D|nr:flagellar motor protein MotB [Aidingimonas lacisalsi]
MSEGQRPIIIRRKKVVKGHHGGSWKIALADFMTALMALFLVMWILSTASEEELEGVAEYFNTSLSAAMAGGDKTTASDSAIPGGGPDPTHQDGERMRIDRRSQTRPSDERRTFRNLQSQLESVIEEDPRLRDLKDQMRLDMTPEGLRIQLVDSEQRPMFELGSDQVEPYMRDLLRTIAPLLNELTNPISITGHTDSLQYASGQENYSNWELSSDRANASRRELISGGLDPDKLLRITGLGDRVPMTESEPGDPVNRRIAILVLDRRAKERIQSQGDPGATIGLPPSPAGESLRSDINMVPIQQFRQGLREATTGE